MTATIITSLVTSLTSLALGYVINKLKDCKKRDNAQTDALKSLLRADLVNQYYAYNEIGRVPKYIHEAWYTQFECYKKLGGNSFVIDIEKKFSKLEIED